MNIDKHSGEPIYLQIVHQIEQMIRDGVLKSGDQLPSVRELGSALLVNPNTVAKSYQDLVERGITVSAHGSGSYVSENAQQLLSAGACDGLTKLEEMIRDLRAKGIAEEAVLAAVHHALGDKGEAKS